MAHRSSVRWLAPVVLIGAAGLVVGETVSTLHHSSPSAPGVGPAARGGRARTTTTTATTTSTTSPRTYTVHAGDLLSTVSQRTGVSIERLKALNPGLDPTAMRVGQRIRLTG